MITIDRIQKDDLKALALLLKELSGSESNYEMMKSTFELTINNDNYILFGAWHDTILAGSLMCIICHDLVGECKPFAVLENVIVLHDKRGRGIGKQMIWAIKRICKEKNCSYIMLASGAHRKPAHAFYESLGYKVDKVEGFKKYL
jgi:GNAT superfamily N-acetyltransferase